MSALESEEKLLGQAGKWAEVDAAEMRHLGRPPAPQTITLRHGLEDPHIDGKGFELGRAEKQHAVGDFFADARQFAKLLLGRRVGQGSGGFKPAGMGGKEACGLVDIAGAKAEQAAAEFGFGNFRKFGPGGKAMELSGELRVES